MLSNTHLCNFCCCCTSRQTGIGTAGMFARLGGVLAPIINMLDNHNPTAPLIIFGTSPLLGAVLALALPETADRPLPDTLEDVETWDDRYSNDTFHFSWFLFRLVSYSTSHRLVPAKRNPESCEDVSPSASSTQKQKQLNTASSVNATSGLY